MNGILLRGMMDIKEQGSNGGLHSITMLSARCKSTSLQNVVDIPGMLPVDHMCNDAFLPLEGDVSLSRSK